MGKIIFSDKEISDIIQKYTKEFLSTTEIGKYFKRDTTTILRVLKENNIKIAKGSAFSVKYWVERGLSEDEAKHKVKTIKPSLVEYWISRGYTHDDAIFQTELHLMNTERAFIHKFGEEIGSKKYREKKIKEGKYNSNRSQEYWLSRGYSIDEAKLKIQEIQKKFSLEICIEKYGKDRGKEIFVKRQEDWIKKIKDHKDYDLINIKKNSKSLDIILKKYPDEFVEKYYSYNIKNPELKILIDSVKNNNYYDFLNLVKVNFEYNSLNLRLISKNKLYQYVFKVSESDLYLDLKRQYGVKDGVKQSYGTIFLIDGYLFRSLGEKMIYENLKNLKIKFIYDTFYPNQNKYKYDFYLVDYDVYVEYFGMLNVKETQNSKKILRNYKNKCKEKLDLCLTQKYKFIFSKNYNEIIEKIKNLNNDKNNYDKRLL
jgi:hypothetical protein